MLSLYCLGATVAAAIYHQIEWKNQRRVSRVAKEAYGELPLNGYTQDQLMFGEAQLREIKYLTPFAKQHRDTLIQLNRYVSHNLRESYPRFLESLTELLQIGISLDEIKELTRERGIELEILLGDQPL